MRKVLILTLMLSMVLGGQFAIWQLRSPIRPAVVTVAGNPAERFDPVGEPLGVVIVAHGFSGSKELMRPWGYELARQGFETYIYDQPGHGDHPGRLEGSHESPALAANLRAIIDELVANGRAKPRRIALVGHSMGGGTVTGAALEDDRVRATVTLSSAYRGTLPADRPANLLSLAAVRDPDFMVQAVEALARASGGGHGELGALYGSFAAGTARASDLVDGTNHITILYDEQVMQRTADWLHASFATEAARPVVGQPWLWILLALVGGLGVVLSLAAALAPEPSRSRAPNTPVRIGLLTGLVTLAVSAFSAVLASVYVRAPWVGMAVVDYLLPYFVVMAVVLLALRMLWPKDFGFPVTLPGQEPVSLILRSFVLFLGFVAAVGPVVQMNLSSFIPTTERLLPLAILAVGLWLYLVQEEAMKRAIANESGQWAAFGLGTIGKLIIAGTWLASLALPNPNGFLPLTLPVALGLLLGLECLGLLFRHWRYPAVGIATFNALVLGWSMAVTFPLV